VIFPQVFFWQLIHSSPALGPPKSLTLFFQQHPTLTSRWWKAQDPELSEEDKLHTTIEEAVEEHNKINGGHLCLLI
jgi:hypothetical protein